MDRENGQAVLIVLLAMAVVLTIVLSIVGSTTTDIKISSNESESLRAFSAAESGVEQALITNGSAQGTVGNVNYSASVTSMASGTSTYNYPSNLVSGDNGILWFVSHDSNGFYTCSSSLPCFTGRTVKVCWGKEGTSANSSTTPAADITLYYLTIPGNYSSARIAKAIYDPNPGRLSSDSYSPTDAGTCTIGGTNYAFGKLVDLSTLGVPAVTYSNPNGLQFMVVRMLYNNDQDQSLGFDVSFAGNSTIPSQGHQVESTGSLNTTTRKVEVSNPYTGFGPLLGTAVYSPSGVTQ